MLFVLFANRIFSRSDMYNAIVFAFVVVINQHHFIVVTFFNHHHFVRFVGMAAGGKNKTAD